MKKTLFALALTAGLALGRPAPAAADFSISIGLPGFGFYAADPCPRPIFYPPPPPPPAYYYPWAPAPVVGVTYVNRYHHAPPYYGRGWGHGRGHWRHR